MSDQFPDRFLHSLDGPNWQSSNDVTSPSPPTVMRRDRSYLYQESLHAARQRRWIYAGLAGCLLAFVIVVCGATLSIYHALLAPYVPATVVEEPQTTDASQAGHLASPGGAGASGASGASAPTTPSSDLSPSQLPQAHETFSQVAALKNVSAGNLDKSLDQLERHASIKQNASSPKNNDKEEKALSTVFDHLTPASGQKAVENKPSQRELKNQPSQLQAKPMQASSPAENPNRNTAANTQQQQNANAFASPSSMTHENPAANESLVQAAQRYLAKHLSKEHQTLQRDPQENPQVLQASNSLKTLENTDENQENVFGQIQAINALKAQDSLADIASDPFPATGVTFTSDTKNTTTRVLARLQELSRKRDEYRQSAALKNVMQQPSAFADPYDYLLPALWNQPTFLDSAVIGIWFDAADFRASYEQSLYQLRSEQKQSRMEFEKASALCGRTLTKKPDDVATICQQLALLHRRSSQDKYQRELDNALQRFPAENSLKMLKIQAQNEDDILMQSRSGPLAFCGELSQQLIRDPQWMAGYQQRSQCWMQLNVPRKAIADLSIVCREQPDNAAACAQLAQAYWRIHDVSQALAWTEAALENDSKLAEAHEVLVQWLLSRSCYVSALRRVDWLLTRTQTQMHISDSDCKQLRAREQALRGQALLGLGRWNDAQDAWRQALKCDATNETAMLGFATLDWKSGKLDRALDWCEQTIQTHERSAGPLLLRAKILRELGLYDRGLADVRKAQQLDETDPQIKITEGWLLLSEDDLAQAQHAATVALSMAPDSAQASLLRAVVLLRGGQPHAASEWARRATQLNPQDATMHAGLAIVRFQAGNFSPAQQSAQKAVEINSNCVQAFLASAMMELSSSHVNQSLLWLDQAVQTNSHCALAYLLQSYCLTQQQRIVESNASWQLSRSCDRNGTIDPKNLLLHLALQCGE